MTERPNLAGDSRPSQPSLIDVRRSTRYRALSGLTGDVYTHRGINLDSLERKRLQPYQADHYIWEITGRTPEGEDVDIDIHNFRNVGQTELFPTVVQVIRYPETAGDSFTDRFYIDAKGGVLAHTNIFTTPEGHDDGRRT